MANPYAVDFSPIAEGIATFKKKKYDKRLKGEVDSLIKKREGLDTSLVAESSKQLKLIEDTPEMDQTANEQYLGEIQNQRSQARTNKYDELGGLSIKDIQGMSTEAVAKYKDYITVERAGAKQREMEDTKSAFLRFESMGQDPSVLKDWFNKYQAHKWGLPDGVKSFETVGTSVYMYENGKDYSKEDVHPTVIPKQQFMQFAVSSLDPATTEAMSQDMRKGVHKQIVRAEMLKKAIDLLDGDVEKGMAKIGMITAEYQKLQGIPVIADVLGDYINVVVDGEVQGLKRSVKGAREVSEKAAPKQVATKGQSGAANKRIELLLKVRDANAKQDKQAAEALYREITSQYGNEDMIAIDKSGNIIQYVKLLKEELNTDIDYFSELVKEEDKPEDKEYLLQLKSWKNAIKETKARGLRTADTNDNIMDIVLKWLDATAGRDITGLGEDRQASPSGIELMPEAGGVSKSRGSSKRVGGVASPALEPHVTMPPTSGMPSSPPVVLRPDARAKRTVAKGGSDLSPEARAARIKELRAKAKKLL